MRKYFDWLCVGLVVFSAFSLLIAVIAAAAGYPPPTGDDSVFLPLALEYGQHGLLRHPFYTPIGGNPDKLLIWHGWLFPLIQGSLTFSPNFSLATLPAAVLAIVLTLGYAGLIAKRSGYILACISFPILVCIFSYQIGRPELIASFVVIFFILGAEMRAVRVPLFVVGTAFLAATNLVVTVFLGLFATAVVWSEAENKKSLLYNTIVYWTMSIVLFLFVMLCLTDLPVLRWFWGIYQHAMLVSKREPFHNFHYYYIINPKMPFVLAYVALVVVAFLAYYLQRGSGYYIIPVVIFVCWLFRNATISSTVYNFVAIIPLIVYFTFRLLSSNTMRFMGTRVVNLILALCVVTSISALARSNAQLLLALAEGNASNQIAKYVSARHSFGQIYTDSLALAMIASSIVSRDHVSFTSRRNARSTGGVWLTLQADSGMTQPQHEPNECVEFSNFHSESPKMLKIPIGNTYKDWSFAVISGC